MATNTVFIKKAPILMGRLLNAFPVWDVEAAAAACGNFGTESAGFTKLQEMKPTVKGSRGGYGWAQWTGPRRKQFEAWCSKMKLDPASDEASMQYIIVELKGPEKAAVTATAKAVGLNAKVKAFERAFERAGQPHYDSRNRYAKIALDAYNAQFGTKKDKVTEPVEIITDHDRVLTVQSELKALGYTEVGIPDGRVGPQTRAAVLAFRADHGLPLKAYIDMALLKALPDAEPRKLAPERANAASIKIATIVPETNKHWWNKYVGLGSTVGLVGGGIVKELPDTFPLIQQAKELFFDVPTIVWIGAAVVIAGTVWWNARQGQIAGDEAFRTGARR